MSTVSYSHIRYIDYGVTHTGSTEYLSRFPVQEPTQAVLNAPRLHPQAFTTPTLIPSALAMLISPIKPDWTSSSFQHNVRELLPLNNN